MVRLTQTICHFNTHNDLPDSPLNGHIFGVFLDNIKASNQHRRLCNYYDECYLDFQSHVIIEHDTINNCCPDIDDPKIQNIAPYNRERTQLFSFINRCYLPERNRRLRGHKLFIIKGTPEAEIDGWGEFITEYIGGVFTHRCCAEKFLNIIIERKLYFVDQEDEEANRELAKFLPIIEEFIEGVSDPEFEKERKAFKDFCFLIKQIQSDPHHPGRKYATDIKEEDWEKWEPVDFKLDSWVETLEDYLNWMKRELKMDLSVEKHGLQSKEQQLYFAYHEIFRLKDQLEKYNLITKKIYNN